MAGAPIRPRFSPKRPCAREVIPCPRGNGDVEFDGHTACRLLPPRCDGPHGLPRLIQYRGRRRLGRAAVEGRLRRIDHVKLDGFCGLVAAQLSRKAQRTETTPRGSSPGVP